jgi:hypothetical protein
VTRGAGLSFGVRGTRCQCEGGGRGTGCWQSLPAVVRLGWGRPKRRAFEPWEARRRLVPFSCAAAGYATEHEHAARSTAHGSTPRRWRARVSFSLESRMTRDRRHHTTPPLPSLATPRAFDVRAESPVTHHSPSPVSLSLAGGLIE